MLKVQAPVCLANSPSNSPVSAAAPAASFATGQARCYLCAAVIVEPRKHCALSFVLREFRKVLGDDWPIIVLHGTENGPNWVKKQAEHIKNCIMKPMPWKNLTTRAYSELLTSLLFWEELKPYEKILIFQTDSLVFDRKASKLTIDRFLEYDYIGAPWRSSTDGCGNGGLSLRSRSAMMKAIREKLLSRSIRSLTTAADCSRHPEDVFFASYFRQANKIQPGRYNLPSVATAKTFSVEHLFYPQPFGLHKCWKHMHRRQWKRLCDENPSLRILRSLQKIEKSEQQPQQRLQHSTTHGAAFSKPPPPRISLLSKQRRLPPKRAIAVTPRSQAPHPKRLSQLPPTLSFESRAAAINPLVDRGLYLSTRFTKKRA